MIEDFKWKTCILNSIMTGFFHKIAQKWKALFLKAVYTLVVRVGERSVCVHPVYTAYQSMRRAVVGSAQNPLLLTKEMCFANAFWLLIPFVWFGGFALLQQILALLRLLLVKLTQRSKSYLSEHFRLKQINFFAVSESLLNNWVVLIEVTAFWSLC